MMKYRGKKVLGALLGACLMSVLASGAAFAATKSISSVSIRVGTNAEAGDTLDSITIIEDSLEPQEDETYAATNSTKYYIRDAEWITSEDRYLSIGDEPKMRLYLYVADDDYAFRGSYGSRNVSVKGGTYVSSRRSSDELEVVVRLNGIKGEYAAPSDASWRDSGYGRAVWNQDQDEDDDYYKAVSSDYYDVYLYRGSTKVKELEDYKGTSYNFYPYMTKKGTYYYKVRSVPHTEEEKKYGKKSEWMESDEMYIDEEHVSDGTGQVNDSGIGGAVGATGQVGWIQSGNTWYYRYPDGTYQQDAWLKLGDIWYLFDSSGAMLTGWQTKNGYTYYLQDSGAMLTGWIKAGDYWYYLNTLQDGGVEGAMRTGWLNYKDKMYYLLSSGAMAEGWTQVDGNWYYFYPGVGYKAVDTYVDTFYVNADGIWRK